MPYQIQFDKHHQSIIVVVLTALTNPLLAEILLQVNSSIQMIKWGKLIKQTGLSSKAILGSCEK